MNLTHIKRKHVVKMLDYCIFTFGPSKFQDEYPSISIKFKVKDKNFLGEYDGEENCIYINVNAHNSALELCSTVIHEYVHYLQDTTKYDMYFYKYRRSYNTHPYEITANSKAEKHKRECKRYLVF
jgi:Zn-dependent peptidase ImmA (M78 family)